MRTKLRSARMLRTLLISYGVLLLLSITSVVVFYASTERIVVKQAMDSGESSLEKIVTETELHLKEIRRVSDCISSSINITNYHYSRQPHTGETSQLVINIVAELTKIKQVTPFIDDLFVYYPKKSAVFSPSAFYTDARYYRSNYQLDGTDLIEFHSVMNNSTFVGDPMPQRMVDIDSKTRYVCFMQTNNTYLFPRMQTGLLVNEQKLENLLGSQSLFTSGQVIALDRNGQPLTGGCAKAFAETFNVPPSEFDATNAAEFLSSPNSTMVLQKFSAATGWNYLLVVPTGALLKQAANLRNILLLLLLVTTAIGLILGLLMAFNNYRPIRKLVSIAEKLAPGNSPLSAKLYETQLIERAMQTMQEANSQMRSHQEKQIDMLRGHLLQRIIRKTICFDEELNRQMTAYKLNLPYERFMVAMFYCQTEDSVFHATDEDARLVRFIISNMTEEALTDLGNSHFIELAPDTLLVLINLRNDLTVEAINDRARQSFGVIVRLLADRFQLTPRVCIGGVQLGMDGIHTSWLQAERLLDFASLQGNEILSIEDMTSYDRAYDFSLETELQLHNLVRSGNAVGAHAQLEQILAGNIKQHRLSEGALQCLFFDLLSTGFKLMQDLHIPPKSLPSFDCITFEQILSGTPTARLRDNLLNFYANLCEYVSLNQTDHSSELNQRILDYIEQNYADPSFSQTRMAEKLGLSSSYLSAFFHSHTGEKMVDYISRRRVVEAKRLLNETTLTLDEIAIRIGCSNAISLIRIFKKHAGITPGQYRNLAI